MLQKHYDPEKSKTHRYGSMQTSSWPPVNPGPASDILLAQEQSRMWTKKEPALPTDEREFAQFKSTGKPRDLSPFQLPDDGMESHKPPVMRVRLILKSRNKPNLGIAVTPSDTVESVAGAYREAYKIPDYESITLSFDGDILEYSHVVEDTELGDMDTVEVHVKQI